MLKRSTQSVYLLCQSSSFERVYSFLLCILPLYPQEYQEILFLERKVIFILLIQVTKSLAYQYCVIPKQCTNNALRKTQLLVSQLLHITPLAHFGEQPMNLQFEAITTTNINFQILHCQVHCFEARLTLILG